VPVDLNALLYGLERAIAAGSKESGDHACTKEFVSRARRRREAMNRYLWNERTATYVDYDWVRGSQREIVSAAMFYPLFVEAASKEQAAQVADAARRTLLKAGGIVATDRTTGQQWDAPNGWAPLQWIAVAGLRNYGATGFAQEIASRWLTMVERDFEATGQLFEKYDVVDPERPGRGGEYELQDGFGWTNGVTAALLRLHPPIAEGAPNRPEAAPAK